MDKKLYLNTIFELNDDIITSIADCTVGQWENEIYIALHTYRITASNFGHVLGAVRRKRYPKTLFEKLHSSYNLEKVCKILNFEFQFKHLVACTLPSTVVQVASVRYGKDNESKALAAFKEYHAKYHNSGDEIRLSG